MALCSIDIASSVVTPWTIPGEITNRGILPVMLADHEYAGTFRVHESGTAKSISVCNKGGAASVKATDGYINFHTHPASCYLEGETVWGWPSGEDMRECISFALKGNLAHLIFTMEGVYSIQVNPNIAYAIRQDKFLRGMFGSVDRSRGVLCSVIESYFKCTHGHRTLEWFEENPGTRPEAWVEFCNGFRLENLFSSKNDCSEFIPCGAFPNADGDPIKLAAFASNFGFEPYSMTREGGLTVSGAGIKTAVNKNIRAAAKAFSALPTTLKYGNEKWRPGQWFKCEFVPNAVVVRGKEVPLAKFVKGKSGPQIQNHWRSGEVRFRDVKIPFRGVRGSKKCSITTGVAVVDFIDSHPGHKH